jgi:hypothetical protein
MQSHVYHALLPDRSPNGSTERVLRDAFWRSRKNSAPATVTLIDTARAKNLSVPHR